METYRSDRKCSKCGGDEINDGYHKAQGHSFRYSTNCPGPYDLEHISRHCRRCHYVWAEACIDNTQAASAGRGEHGESVASSLPT